MQGTFDHRKAHDIIGRNNIKYGNIKVDSTLFAQPLSHVYHLIAVDTTISSNNKEQYTAKLYTAILDSVIVDNLSADQMYYLLKTISNWNNEAAIDLNMPFLGYIIKDYWYNKMASHITKTNEDDFTLKYSFKYKYITHRLGEEKYYPSIRLNYPEKIVLRLKEGRINYVIGRIFLEAKNKMGLTISIIFTIIAIIVFIIVRNNKKKK